MESSRLASHLMSVLVLVPGCGVPQTLSGSGGTVTRADVDEACGEVSPSGVSTSTLIATVEATMTPDVNKPGVVSSISSVCAGTKDGSATAQCSVCATAIVDFVYSP